MFTFSQKLDHILNEWEDSYDREYTDLDDYDWISPDSISGPGAIPFIYHHGKMYYGGSGYTHGDIIRRFPDLDSHSYVTSYDDDSSGIMLYGRVNASKNLVSFWNSYEHAYDDVGDCLHTLIKDGKLKPDAAVSTPLHHTVAMKDVAWSKARAVSPEEKDQIEQKRQLHLMSPAQKREALIKAGVPFSKKNAWQVGTEKAGLISPGHKWWAPTSESIKEWDDSAAQAYLDPDTFLKEGRAIPFFYTSERVAYYGDPTETHGQVICHNQDLYDRYINLFGMEFDDSFDDAWGGYRESPQALLKMAKKRNLRETLGSTATFKDESDGSEWDSEYRSGQSSSNNDTWRRCTTSVDLLGRVDGKKTTVSFWNDNGQIYQHLLSSCIKQLVTDGRLSPHGYFSTPVHGTVPIAQLATAKATALTDEQREELRLREKLHTMGGIEKHDAMQKLGVPKSRTSPWTAELQKIGAAVPGQKLWAPTSEAFELRLIAILKESEGTASYIGPDLMNGRGTVPFIRYKGKMFYGGQFDIHADILANHANEFSANQSAMNNWWLLGPARYDDERLGVMLYGRVNADRNLASFWNGKPHAYDDIRECINDLIKDGMLSPHAYISTPLLKTIPIDDLATASMKPLSPEEQQSLQQQRELHLKNPIQKRDAMRKMGVPFSKKNQWDTALQKIGAAAPGQKQWAPTSEDRINNIAVLITADPDITSESTL